MCALALNLLYINHIIRDITERKKTEESIAKERNIAQNYLDVANIMLIALDANQKITLINKKGLKILGYKEGELIGKNWFDNCLPADIRQEVKKVFNKLIAGNIKPVEYYENPVITKKGDKKIIFWHNSILRDNGKIVGILSSGEDITEKKKAEEELKESEEKYKTLTENSPDCINLVDLQGDLLYMNKGGLKEHGLKSLDEAKRKKWKIVDTVEKKYHSKTEEAFQKTLEGEKIDIEIKHRQSTSNRKFCYISFIPIKDSNGKVVSVFMVSRDITQHKEVEKNLKTTQKN